MLTCIRLEINEQYETIALNTRQGKASDRDGKDERI